MSSDERNTNFEGDSYLSKPTLWKCSLAMCSSLTPETQTEAGFWGWSCLRPGSDLPRSTPLYHARMFRVLRISKRTCVCTWERGSADWVSHFVGLDFKGAVVDAQSQVGVVRVIVLWRSCVRTLPDKVSSCAGLKSTRISKSLMLKDCRFEEPASSLHQVSWCNKHFKSATSHQAWRVMEFDEWG